ncbi:MAG: hypothetical protein ABI778_12000, partial [Ignavibacteriota bacterium]
SNTVSNGLYSVAMGSQTTTDGDFSTATGAHSAAQGTASVAMGSYTTASGDYSVALGDHTTAGGSNSFAIGKGITTGQRSFAFNSGVNSASVDLSGMDDVAYIGDANLIIGNDDNTPRSIRFYGPNNSADLSGGFYSGFKAQTQSENISYILPASQGSTNSLMLNNGSGALSWTSLSALGVPTGNGSVNQLTVWNSSSELGAASSLYFDQDMLGIGVTPSEALDVGGNAHVSGNIAAGGTTTTNGLVVSGGTTVLSNGNVSINQSTGTITIPNVSVVNIVDDASSMNNTVAMPSGTNGQIIYIYNSDADDTSGDVTIASHTMGVFVYIAGGWQRAN